MEFNQLITKPFQKIYHEVMRLSIGIQFLQQNPFFIVKQQTVQMRLTKTHRMTRHLAAFVFSLK